jgi:hypothetical protein
VNCHKTEQGAILAISPNKNRIPLLEMIRLKSQYAMAF